MQHPIPRQHLASVVKTDCITVSTHFSEGNNVLVNLALRKEFIDSLDFSFPPYHIFFLC